MSADEFPTDVQAPVDDYPEHSKLRAIADRSQAIHDFLEWANETHGLWVASRYCLRFDHPENPRCEDGECEMSSKMLPTDLDHRRLLAEFFDIDMNKIEAEKRAMLERLREANA